MIERFFLNTKREGIMCPLDRPILFSYFVLNFLLCLTIAPEAQSQQLRGTIQVGSREYTVIDWDDLFDGVSIWDFTNRQSPFLGKRIAFSGSVLRCNEILDRQVSVRKPEGSIATTFEASLVDASDSHYWRVVRANEDELSWRRRRTPGQILRRQLNVERKVRAGARREQRRCERYIQRQESIGADPVFYFFGIMIEDPNVTRDHKVVVEYVAFADAHADLWSTLSPLRESVIQYILGRLSPL